MDESAIITVHVPLRIIAEKNAKQVSKAISAEHGILITAICCLSIWKHHSSYLRMAK